MVGDGVDEAGSDRHRARQRRLRPTGPGPVLERDLRQRFAFSRPQRAAVRAGVRIRLVEADGGHEAVVRHGEPQSQLHAVRVGVGRSSRGHGVGPDAVRRRRRRRLCCPGSH